MFRYWVEKVGLANFVSFLSLMFSVTSLVVVARISSNYTREQISTRKPIVIGGNGGNFKIENISNNRKIDSGIAYDLMRDSDIEIEIPKKQDSSVDIDIVNSSKKESLEERLSRQSASIDNRKESIKINDLAVKNGESIVSYKNQSVSVTNEQDLESNIAIKVPMPVKAPKYLKSGSDSNVVQRSQEANFEQVKGKIKKVDAKPSGKKIRLAIFNTHSEAVAGWFRIKREHERILGGLHYAIDNVPGPTNGSSMYRLYIEANSENDALSMCNLFGANGLECRVVD